MAFRTNKTPVLQEKSASGAVATFNTALAMPLSSCNIAITVTQSGSGTPSPDNVRPISGYSAIHIGSDAKYAGFINFNQIVGDTYNTTTFEGITTSYDSTTNEYSIRNDNRTAKYNTGSTHGIVSAILPQVGHVYYADIISDADVEGVIIGVATGAVAYNYPFIGTLTSYPEGQTFHLRVDYRYDFVNKHPIGDITKFKIVLMDLTEMFGAGNEPTTIDEFKSLFPNDYYEYNAGTLTTVSAVNGSTNSFFTINLGGTYYGGEYDARTGVLTVTHGYIASYNGEVINEPWISSMDKYVEGGIPTSGAQVVYLLTTPTTIQLPPCPIDTLEGVNNIFADTGDIDLTYKDLDIAKRGSFREVFKLPS